MKRLFLEADILGQWTRPHSLHEEFQDHGMGLLLTLARDNGFDFDVLSLKSMNSWAELRMRLKGYDLVCMNVRSWRYIYAKRTAEIFKKVNPQGQVWVGGMHATVCPQEMEEIPEFDVIVSREAEGTWLTLLSQGGSEKRVLKGETFPFDNMDDLPFVDRSLWPKSPNPIWPLEGPGGWGPGPKAASMVTARRCPFHCLDGETLIMMSDLTWKKLKDVSVGDSVIGIEKTTYGHKVIATQVYHTLHRQAEAFRLTTNVGVIITTGEHPWLSHANHSRWRPTRNLKAGDRIRKLTSVTADTFESQQYKYGYLGGAVVGDGYIGLYRRKPPRNPDTFIYRFGLVGDDQMLDAFLSYAKELNVSVAEARFNGGKIYPHVNRIVRSGSKASVERIYQIAHEESPSSEYKRGFLSGFFDADGSAGREVVRFHNRSADVLNRIAEYLASFQFHVREDTKHGVLSGLHLMGGRSEKIRFLSLVRPKVTHKYAVIGDSLGNDFATVLSIEPIGLHEVYNLSTKSENFIADGLVSHNCSFCYPAESNHFTKFRRRSVSNVCAELNYVLEKWGDFGTVIFHDSEFLMHRPWLEEFVETYPRTTKHWPFWASCRADMMAKWPDLVTDLHRKANWHCFSIGLESGSQKVLDIMNKETTLEQNYEAIELVNRLVEEDEREGRRPPVIFANVMLAIPGEEPEDAFDTIRMLKRIRKVIPSISWFTPYPGSTLGDKIIAEGRSLDTHKNYLRFPGEPKVAGIDYQFYVDLFNGKYDREIGLDMVKLLSFQGSPGDALS